MKADCLAKKKFNRNYLFSAYVESRILIHAEKQYTYARALIPNT